MRPKSPLLARLARLLDLNETDLSSAIEHWPNPFYSKCIQGPASIWLGKSVPPMRAIFEIITASPCTPLGGCVASARPLIAPTPRNGGELICHPGSSL